MVAGRAHGTERGVGPASTKGLDRGDPSTSGEQGGVPRTGARPRVRIEMTATGAAHGFEVIYVGARMHALDLLARGGYRFEGDEAIGDAGVLRSCEHRREACGAFRMPFAREVIEVRRVGGEEQRHARNATVGHW
jgi:hypothetical protein